MSMGMARSLLLETRALTVRFGGVTALDSVDFRLAPKELRCLIGPNGAGKSTFFKCLCGLLPPTKGRYFFKEQDVTGLPSYRIARLGLGVKMQTPSVLNCLNVRENIWLATARGLGSLAVDERAERIMAQLGLTDRAERKANTLSHGGRQLLELAIALAGQPSLLLLDEPTAGLTATEIRQMAQIIQDANQTTAIIVVEHNMHFVRQIAQKVTVLNQGRILTEGTVEQVLNDPDVQDVYLGQHEYDRTG